MLAVRIATDAKVRTGCLQHEAMRMSQRIRVLNTLSQFAKQCPTQRIEMRRVVEDDHYQLLRLVPCKIDERDITAAFLLAPDNVVGGKRMTRC
jgi:hypothetical protein